MSGDVCAIVFDFDGTLTASPGEVAIRGNKQDELCDRSSLLAPRLQALRGAGITLCIMSKSSETTIRSALQASGLAQFFDGPLVAKAVGFEGKAGFIKELVQTGDLQHLGAENLLGRVLLVDDDVYELDRAQVHGIQTYAVPEKGGLQEKDFDTIFAALGLPQ
jgi:phosphoglycolate phosphatase-like HAD superfamily hydrolase